MRHTPGAGVMIADGPIDDYLDELARHLKCGRRAKSEILAEVEDHLRESAEQARASGLSVEAAERRAITEFGATAVVASWRTARPTATRLLLPLGMVVGLVGLAGFVGGLQSFTSEGARQGLAVGWAVRSDVPPSHIDGE